MVCQCSEVMELIEYGWFCHVCGNGVDTEEQEIPIHMSKILQKKVEQLELSLASALDVIQIRERKIKLQAEEIVILKKLLASFCSGNDTKKEEFPKYDELTEKDFNHHA